MKTTKSSLVLLVISIIFLCLVSCSRRSPDAIGLVLPDPSPTPLPDNYGVISGSLNLPAAAEGKTYNVYIYSTFTNYNDTAGSVTGTCGPGSPVSFSLAAPEGAYYAVVYIDMDSSGSITPGDFVGVHGNTWPDFPADASVTITPGETTQLSINLIQADANVTGDIMLFQEVPGNKIRIYMDTDLDQLNNNHVAYSEVQLSQGQTGVSYSMLVLIPGFYYLYGWIDVNNNSMPDSGDQLGYNGVCSCSPTTPPQNGPTTSPFIYLPTYFYFNTGLLP